MQRSSSLVFLLATVLAVAFWCASAQYIYEYRHKNGFVVDIIYQNLAQAFKDSLRLPDIKSENPTEIQLTNFKANTCEFIEEKFERTINEGERKLTISGGKFALFFDLEYSYKEAEDKPEKKGRAKVDFHFDQLQLDVTFENPNDAPSVVFTLKGVFPEEKLSDVIPEGEVGDAGETAQLQEMIARRIRDNAKTLIEVPVTAIYEPYFKDLEEVAASKYNKQVSYGMGGVNLVLKRNFKAFKFLPDAIVYEIDGLVDGVENIEPAVPKFDEIGGDVRIYFNLKYIFKVIQKLKGDGLFKTTLQRETMRTQGFDFYAGNLFYIFPELEKKYFADEELVGEIDAEGPELQIEISEFDQMSILSDFTLLLKKKNGGDLVQKLTINLGLSIALGVNSAAQLDVMVQSVLVNGVTLEEDKLTENQRKVLDTLVEELATMIQGQESFGSGLPGPRMSNSRLFIGKEHLIIYGAPPKDGFSFTD